MTSFTCPCRMGLSTSYMALCKHQRNNMAWVDTYLSWAGRGSYSGRYCFRTAGNVLILVAAILHIVNFFAPARLPQSCLKAMSMLHLGSARGQWLCVCRRLVFVTWLPPVATMETRFSVTWQQQVPATTVTAKTQGNGWVNYYSEWVSAWWLFHMLILHLLMSVGTSYQGSDRPQSWRRRWHTRSGGHGSANPLTAN